MAKAKSKVKAGSRALTDAQKKAFAKQCVEKFKADEHLFKTAASSVVSACLSDPVLKEYIHFIKHRTKDPKHLKDKLLRKMGEPPKRGKYRVINPSNLYREVTDLAGVRILHLYSDQIEAINTRLLKIFEEQRYEVVEGPVANCWDSDAETFYSALKFETKQRDSMYTSIHYTVRLNPETGVGCEIQVRTLADEVWGEVSHTVNYPKPTKSVACLEQLKVLARVTSGATWLVNSIFRSKAESERRSKRVRRKKKPGD
ncbi:MAG: RelA/SpoT domain-containing protein [Phycisphaerales bacterium]